VIEVARRVISESLWATRIAAGSDLGPTTIFHVMVQRCAMSDGSTTDPTLVVLGTEKTAWERLEQLLPTSQAKRNGMPPRAECKLDRGVRVTGPARPRH
jgi:hypothetical protein